MMNSEEILTYLMLIVIGYFIAKMFSRCSGNGFSVGCKRVKACATLCINNDSDNCESCPECAWDDVVGCYKDSDEL